MNNIKLKGMNEDNRFPFGKNWSNFLKILTEEQILGAVTSLKSMLCTESLKGKSFLDVGSGSGLFSLAAYRLGSKVHSFDYDSQSVSCTQYLKKNYGANNPEWVIEESSILDENIIKNLGTFDIVYSWGVLHHTGSMYLAFENISQLVAPEGTLYIAIYNDQGLISKYWLFIKKAYNTNIVLRYIIIILHAPYLFFLRYINRALTKKLKIERGMSIWYDMLDWLGGYPFEVAKPEKVFEYFKERGFVLNKMKTCAGKMGCNEFIFRKI